MKLCTFLINLSFCQMRMEAELEDMAMEYERTHAAAIITEKRGKNFDKVMGEWKAKADDLMSELEACR